MCRVVAVGGTDDEEVDDDLAVVFGVVELLAWGKREIDWRRVSRVASSSSSSPSRDLVGAANWKSDAA